MKTMHQRFILHLSCVFGVNESVIAVQRRSLLRTSVWKQRSVKGETIKPYWYMLAVSFLFSSSLFFSRIASALLKLLTADAKSKIKFNFCPCLKAFYRGKREENLSNINPMPPREVNTEAEKSWSLYCGCCCCSWCKHSLTFL